MEAKLIILKYNLFILSILGIGWLDYNSKLIDKYLLILGFLFLFNVIFFLINDIKKIYREEIFVFKNLYIINLFFIMLSITYFMVNDIVTMETFIYNKISYLLTNFVFLFIGFIFFFESYINVNKYYNKEKDLIDILEDFKLKSILENLKFYYKLYF